MQVRVGEYRATFVTWGHIPPQRWRNYPHVHSYFEVCYAYAGRGTFEIQGVEYIVRSGDIFVAGPGDVHEIRSEDEGQLGIYFWGYTLVQAAPGGEITHESAGDDLIDRFVVHDGSPVASASPQLAHTLELLAAEAAAYDAVSAIVIAGQAVGLVIRTASAIVGPAGAVEAPRLLDRDEAVARTIERYLRDNVGRDVRLRDVAAQVHLSERHTSRIFSRVLGKSIRTYLRSMRLELAAQRLLERPTSVTEVALACGYPDVHHFVTAFRRHTGLTPTQFREHGGTSMLPRRSESLTKLGATWPSEPPDNVVSIR